MKDINWYNSWWSEQPARWRVLQRLWWITSTLWCVLRGKPGPGERLLLETASELARKLERAELLRDGAVTQCERVRSWWLEERRERRRLERAATPRQLDGKRHGA